MSARSVLGLLYMIQGLEAAGIDYHPVLSRYGLSVDRLDPTALMDRTQELTILTDLFASVEEPALGLKLGKGFGLAGYGPYSMLLMTAMNTYEACKVGVHYQQLTYILGELTLDLKSSTTTLNIHPQMIPQPIFRYMVDRDISGALKLIEDMALSVGESLEIIEVWFPYPEPSDITPYQERFKCKVMFGQPMGRIIVNNAHLNVPFPQANNLAFEHYRRQCDEQLTQQNRFSADLPGQVAQYLGLFSHKFPSIKDICRCFNIPERTLRRRLSQDETSYQKLLDQVREAKADHLLLQTTHSIESIAHKLGYAEPAAFNHAFQRWTGQTPSSYRKGARVQNVIRAVS